MRILLRIFPLALMLLGATLLFQRPAYAYADPGTGLLAIQASGFRAGCRWMVPCAGGFMPLFHRGSAGEA